MLEETLLDVKNLLKNPVSTNMTGEKEKKDLMNTVGLQQYYKKKGEDDKTLIFESRFESGNLAAATKVTDNEYHLLLQNDVNTAGHTQWFFF